MYRKVYYVKSVSKTREHILTIRQNISLCKETLQQEKYLKT